MDPSHSRHVEQAPSGFLKSLASSHEPRMFQHILSKHLYPFLDRLPVQERKALVTELATAVSKYEGITLVGYEEKSKSFSRQLEALQRHVRTYWRQGYDEQVGLSFNPSRNPHLHSFGHRVI
jgi:hypothetical protein